MHSNKKNMLMQNPRNDYCNRQKLDSTIINKYNSTKAGTYITHTILIQ